MAFTTRASSAPPTYVYEEYTTDYFSLSPPPRASSLPPRPEADNKEKEETKSQSSPSSPPSSPDYNDYNNDDNNSPPLSPPLSPLSLSCLLGYDIPDQGSCLAASPSQTQSEETEIFDYATCSFDPHDRTYHCSPDCDNTPWAPVWRSPSSDQDWQGEEEAVGWGSSEELERPSFFAEDKEDLIVAARLARLAALREQNQHLFVGGVLRRRRLKGLKRDAGRRKSVVEDDLYNLVWKQRQKAMRRVWRDRVLEGRDTTRVLKRSRLVKEVVVNEETGRLNKRVHKGKGGEKSLVVPEEDSWCVCGCWAKEGEVCKRRFWKSGVSR